MNEIKRNGIWAAVFLTIILLSVSVILIHKSIPNNAVSAKIVQNSKVIRTINLSDVKEPYEFTVANGSGGENTIRVENGRIAVIHANCPDKICVRRGFASDGAFPIVCLPNKLSVIITDSENDVDAIAGGDSY